MSNARIIYITGMKPKPEPAVHRRELKRVLAASLARIDPQAAAWLDAREENFVLVSWTSLFYDVPRDIGLDLPGIERLLAQPLPTPADRRDADAVARQLYRIWHLIGDSFPWISAIVASDALRVTLADVHRYVDNWHGVADRIRRLLIDELERAWAAGERVLVLAHSLGSVIAYDSLWLLSHDAAFRAAGRVDVLLTMGSPLATRFIRKGLKGADRQGVERYPTNIDRWINVAARGEMVALHRSIRPYFAEMLRLRLVREIVDESSIYNHFRTAAGLNVHKSYGYLNHPAVAGPVRRFIGAASEHERTSATG